MKITIVFLLLSISIIGQSNKWINTGGPFKGSAISIAIDSNDLLYALTQFGIYRSSDYGSSWNEIHDEFWKSHLPKFILGNYIPGEIKITYNGNIFVVTGDSLLYRSTDKGSSWISLENSIGNKKVRNLTLSPDGNAYIQVDSIKILYSTDYGNTWSNFNYNLNVSTINSLFVGPSNMMIMRTDTVVYRSTDGGNNWDNINDKIPYAYFPPESFAFDSNDYIYASYKGYFGATSNIPLIFRTTDKGNNWSTIYFAAGDQPFEIYFLSDINVNSIGDVFIDNFYSIMRSTDHGDTWKNLLWNISGIGNVNNYKALPFNMVFDSENNAYFETHIGYGITKLNDKDSVFNYIAPSFSDIKLNSLKIDRNSNLFACTDSGLYRSTNTGNDWQNVLHHFPFPSQSMSITSNGFIFADESYAGTWFSADQGNSWDSLGNYGNIFSSNVDSSIFSWYNEGYLSTSIDYGNKWSLVDSGSSIKFNPDHIALNTDGDFFASKSFWLLHSTDYGKTWKDTVFFYDPLHTDINEIAFDTKGYVYIASDIGIFKSTDDGNNWVNINYDLPLSISYMAANANGQIEVIQYCAPIVKSLLILRNDKVYIGYENGVYYLDEINKTWISYNDNFNPSICSLAIDPDGYLYAATSNGTVFKTPQSVTGINDITKTQPKEYSLEQNYPNPFNPTTTISYSLPKASNVKLTIYNLLGQEVTTLVNSFNQAGKHSIQFNAAKLASGVYICSIKADNFSAAKKLILLK